MAGEIRDDNLSAPPEFANGDRLDSWKEIAEYLKRDIRTVQRWEKEEGLPVRRLVHQRRASVYAYRAELNAWWRKRAQTFATEEPGAGRAVTVGPRPPRRILWAVALGAALILGVTAVVWVRGRAPQPPVTRPFTTYAGGEYEPAFSPDGQRIAFVWDGPGSSNFQVYVRQVRAEGLLRLTSGSAQHGSPAWSPDGGSLAFVRYGQPPDGCGVFVVPALGGPERKLASIFPIGELHDRHLDWSPRGDVLAVADRSSAEGAFSIYLVSSTDGRRRRLTAPPANSEGDTGPAFSPDGRFIAFRRTMSASVNDTYVVASTGGEPRRLTFDNRFTSAHAWTPEGDEIVFSSTRQGMLDLWRVQARGGRPRLIPNAGQGANFLSIARTGNRLAYSQWFSDTNIWRYDLRDTHAEPALPLISSTRADVSPQYSPDGTRIAFRSDRSGANEIWVADADGGNAQPLTSSNGVLTGTPRWSPDGRWIAFDSRPEGFSQIFVVAASGGPPRQVTTGPRDNVTPSWSADGQWIYFASMGTGTWQVWKTPADATAAQDRSVQVTKNGGFVAFESADGRFVYYAKGKSSPGVWRVAVQGGPEEMVLPDLRPGLWGNWALTRDELYYVEPFPDGRAELLAMELASARTRRIRPLRRAPVTNETGLAVSSDGASLLYVQPDHSGSDIMLVEGFR